MRSFFKWTLTKRSTHALAPTKTENPKSTCRINGFNALDKKAHNILSCGILSRTFYMFHSIDRK